MASAQTGTAVVLEVRIDASPETVFDFFTEPDKMIQWMGRAAELDPRSGGLLRVDLNGRHVARGEYLTVDPPRRIVFTWGWEAEESPVRPGASTVEVTFNADGDGTLVELVHRDLPSEESRTSHRHGWDHYLPRLAEAAGGGDPGTDPWSTPAGVEAD